ncbi:MAG TPA: hypothetical protein VE911_04075 [Candidatus Nitrosopolaris sp.]|nr:hypothetical protein [Candidatus Nitrosopolaris sp.]
MNPFLAALLPILFGALQLTILMVAIRVTRAERERQSSTPYRIDSPAPSDDFPKAA